MSGMVCVVPVGAGAPQVESEVRALGRRYTQLRGGSGEVVGSGAARAVAFDAALEEGEHGWTTVQGALHGQRRAPMTRDDLDRCDGQFSMFSHDVNAQRTLLATDRFAAAPVYVARREDLLYASTSALALAAHLRPAVDADGLRNFLVAGYQFGAETHWDGVRRLEPGTVLEIDGDEVHEHTYWRPRVDDSMADLSLAQTAEALIDVSVETLAARLGDTKSWLDLTGGYDSRLLALLLDAAGVSFWANTRPSSVGPDVELAGRIIERTGWDWRPLELPEDWPGTLPPLMDHALAAADGRLEVLQLSRVAWAHRHLAASNPRLLSAGGGEHLQYYAWNTELLRPWGDTPDIARWVDMIALKPADHEVLAPGSRDQTRRAYVSRFSDLVGGYAEEPKTRQLDVCYAYKSGGHFGAYRAADDVDIAAQLPYFFEPIFTAAFSVPRRHRAGFRLMRATMERLDPAVAAVETTRGGPALPMRPRTFRQYLPYYAILGRKGVNKVTGRVLGRPAWPFPRNFHWPEREANAAAVSHLQQTGVLDWDQLRVAPLLSRTGVDRLRAGQADSAMLGRVLTAEMALAASGTEL